MRRPALLSLALYALGIFWGKILNVPVFYIAVLLISLLLGLLIVHLVSSENLFSYLLSVALLLTGSLSYSLSTRWYPSHHISSYLNRELLLGGMVLDEPEEGSEYTTFLCRSEWILSCGERVSVSGKVLVRWRKSEKQVEYGDVVELRGRLNPPSGLRNPGGFDYRDYLSQKGVYGILSVKSEDLKVATRGLGNPFLARVILPIKSHVRNHIETSLGGDPAGLLRGVLLGERRAISGQVKEVFSNTGVIHVLAVSGLHVGIVLSILFLFLRLLRLPLKLTLIGVSALLPLYAFITGLRPSVIRATVMAVCLLCGWFLERETDPLNILGFAGLVILLCHPQSLFDVGFQLSFVATASILWLYPRLNPLLSGFLGKRRRGWSRRVASPFTISISAQLGVIPLVAYHFFKVPIIPIFANLIIVPLVGAAISLGFASSLASLVSQKLAGVFSASNWLVLSSTLKLVRFLDSLPFASLRIGRPSPFLISLYYLAFIGLANWKSSVVARKVVIFSLLIGLNLFIWTGVVTQQDLEATFLDVGRGESCFLRFPDGRTLLVNGGRRGKRFDAGKDVIAPFLWSRGIRRINLLVLSNPYNDHVGGLPYILENFAVDLVAEPGYPHPSWGYQRFLEVIEEKSIPYRVVRKGDAIEDLGIPIYVLHPPEGAFDPDSDMRQQSVVLKFTYGEVTFLFPGDHRGPALYGEVDVLKVPCYGISELNLQDLGQSLSPRIGVCSAGGDCPRCEEVLKRDEDMGTKIYRTDLNGAVILRTDGKEIWVRTMSTTGSSHPNRVTRSEIRMDLNLPLATEIPAPDRF